MGKLDTALGNADFHEDTVSSAVDPTATAPPEPHDACGGVSVRYVRSADKRWYVLRNTYARTDRAKDLLREAHLEYYLPMTRAWKHQGKKRRRCMQPLLPSLMFVYGEPDRVKALVDDPANNVLNYYYNKCQGNAFGGNPPLTVSYESMQNFILATGNAREHVVLFGEQSPRLVSHQRVRVTGGPFEGVEGYVVRAQGQQRVWVELEGVASLGTAYVPTYWLQPIQG